MIKLIALDLDHTLLDKDKTIDKKTLAYLRELYSKGIKIALCTGRATATTAYYAGLIGDEVYCNTYNGSILYSLKNGREEVGMLSFELIQSLISYAREKGLFLQLYNGDVIIVEKPCDELYRDPDLKNISFEAVENFDKVFPFSSPKAMIVDSEDKIKDEMIELKERFGEQINVTQSEGNLIEILPATVSKQGSMKKICDQLKINSDEVLAIGDNLNDLDMITWANYGCAVGNAIQELKEKAIYISESKRSQGVLEILEHYFPDDKND